MIIRKVNCIAGSIFFSLSQKSMAKNPKKIAFLKVGSIGDVVMTTPFVRAMRKKFPDTHFTYIVGSWSKAVLEGNPYIDEIITFNENIIYKKNASKIIELIRDIKKEKFDVIFVLDKSYLFSLFAFFTGIKTRIGFNRYGEGFANTHNVEYKKARHEIDFYLDMGEFYDIDKSDRKPDFFISEKNREIEHAIKKRKYAVVMPGGARNPGIVFDYFRIWPKERYAELIKKLAKKYTIVLIGGKDDREICSFIEDSAKGENIINFCGITSLKQAGAIIKEAQFVVCNDSGPMHIASALNERVISLFGASSPYRKAPLNKKSRWLWKDADIYEQRYEIFGRKPKSKDFMKRIAVEDVLKAIDEVVR